MSKSRSFRADTDIRYVIQQYTVCSL